MPTKAQVQAQHSTAHTHGLTNNKHTPPAQVGSTGKAALRSILCKEHEEVHAHTRSLAYTSNINTPPAQVGSTGKAALQSILCKEHVVRQLYRSEVLWLVYQTQSRALGKKMVTQELQASGSPTIYVWVHCVVFLCNTDSQ